MYTNFHITILKSQILRILNPHNLKLHYPTPQPSQSTSQIRIPKNGNTCNQVGRRPKKTVVCVLHHGVAWWHSFYSICGIASVKWKACRGDQSYEQKVNPHWAIFQETKKNKWIASIVLTYCRYYLCIDYNIYLKDEKR